MLWAHLIHLSTNMWWDRRDPRLSGQALDLVAKPHLRFDQALWNELLPAMRDAGLNTVVIDLGDAVRYESHPEIAVKGAWSVEKLRDELSKIREMGLEPIPKLNFSATHDIWLGPYSRMLSTPRYYEVCRDLISEVIDIFDSPKLFHLGMDEETAEHQAYMDYVVVRQHDLWWHDLYFLVDQVEKRGVRAWVWSDYLWNNREAFLAKMPKSVLQSNWYYGSEFDLSSACVKAYLDLDENGYDQMPTGSNYSSPLNFERTVEFCCKHIATDRLVGFLQTTWCPVTKRWRSRHMAAVEQAGNARRRMCPQ